MKNIFILGFIAVLVAATVVYALLFHQPTQRSTSENAEQESAITNTETTPVDESFSGQDTLKALLSYGKDLECVITYVPSEYESEITGTYFVSGGSIRGDFLMNSPELGGQVLSSIIIKDNEFYSWSNINGATYGMKMSLDAMQNSEGNGAVKEPVPQDAVVEYTCDTWSPVDGSVFVPPGNVLFQDYSKLMQTGMEYGTLYTEERN